MAVQEPACLIVKVWPDAALLKCTGIPMTVIVAELNSSVVLLWLTSVIYMHALTCS